MPGAEEIRLFVLVKMAQNSLKIFDMPLKTAIFLVKVTNAV